MWNYCLKNKIIVYTITKIEELLLCYVFILDTVRDDLKESQLLLALKKCEKEIWTDSMKQKLKTISKSLSN